MCKIFIRMIQTTSDGVGEIENKMLVGGQEKKKNLN